MSYYVYIIQSAVDDSYYVGSTQDIEARLLRHNQGRSKYTKARRPWVLVHTEKFPSRSEAVKRENQIKARKSRKFIEKLVTASRQS